MLRRPVRVGTKDPGQAVGSAEHINGQNKVREHEQDAADHDDQSGGGLAAEINGDGFSQHGADNQSIENQHLLHKGVIHLNEGRSGYKENSKSRNGQDEPEIPEPELFQFAKSQQVHDVTQGKNQQSNDEPNAQEDVGTHTEAQSCGHQNGEAGEGVIMMIEIQIDTTHNKKPAAGDTFQPQPAENVVTNQAYHAAGYQECVQMFYL